MVRGVQMVFFFFFFLWPLSHQPQSVIQGIYVLDITVFQGAAVSIVSIQFNSGKWKPTARTTTALSFHCKYDFTGSHYVGP